MKRILLFVHFSLALLLGTAQAQTITLTFNGKDSLTQSNLPLQSVFIRNITRSCDTTIYGTNPSILLETSIGIQENSRQGLETFTLDQNIPNPFRGSTNVSIHSYRKGILHLSISNPQGKIIADYKNEFSIGLHQFEITCSNHNILILNVSDGNVSKSIKLLNIDDGTALNGIRYVGLFDQKQTNACKLKETSGFVFYLGDSLSYTASAYDYYDETINDAPLQNASYTFLMTLVPQLDGYYVKGSVTAYPFLNENAMMMITRNEVNQTLRTSLLELYIPIKAGSDGFSITQVNGAVRKTFGPESGFGFVTNPAQYEPTIPFQRGPVSETSTTRFTVPEDGFYHVVFDYELNKAAIMRVHWGIIGTATPSNGWSVSTDLTESAFNLTTMSWELSDLPLKAGEWKFRYSNGWKVFLDTAVDIGGGLKGVSVNTNFGGDVNALVPGGPNIVNTIPGLYTCNMTYMLGSNYTATLVKTGNLPFTNWTGVVSDAVGTGISSDNPTATPDTSSWHWGNQMLGDNGGIPAVAIDKYTWTWTNIILEANEGFKVRSLNGLTPPSGGTYFDVGYSSLNIGASSPKIIDNGGNLMATEKGSYTSTLIIDAANYDSKELIIIEN